MRVQRVVENNKDVWEGEMKFIEGSEKTHKTFLKQVPTRIFY